MDITVSITGNGNFSPFQNNIYPYYWEMGGTVSATDDQPTDIQFKCTPQDPNAIYTLFGAVPSNGGQSGYIDTGVLPARYSAESIFGIELGGWTVNTSPVLSSDGIVNGNLSTKGYYVVQVAEDKTEDDLIDVNPAIDGITKVYAGDIIYSTATGTGRRWNLSPKERLPKPDRTFFWTPNTSPFIEADGKVNGVMAKPGTVMLPTSNYAFEDPSAPFYNQYAYAGIGWMFDGQRWIGGRYPFRYQPPTPEGGEPPPAEYRDLDVVYQPSNPFGQCLESTQRNKPFIRTTKRINDGAPIIFTYKPEGSDPESMPMKFRWFWDTERENYLQAPTILTPVYDFGDAWTAYHKANVAWLKARGIQTFLGAGCRVFSDETDPPLQIELNVDCFEDGNVTTIVEEFVGEDGNTYTNTFQLTVSITMSMA